MAKHNPCSIFDEEELKKLEMTHQKEVSEIYVLKYFNKRTWSYCNYRYIYEEQWT